jgi:hypothetical protein
MRVAGPRTGDIHYRPLDDAGPHAILSSTSILSGWLRLLRIDLKRGGGIWIAPFGIIIAWLTLRGTLTPGVAIWPEITEAISTFSGPLTLLAVALGAIAGGRERRLETDELIGATGKVAWQRFLSLTMSIFLWALGIYAAFAGSLLAYGALRSTWGGPEWGVTLVPVPVLALGATFGVLIVRGFRDRSSPVIAVALFMLVFVVAFMPSRSVYTLSVFNLNSWFRPVVENAPERPFSSVLQLAWGIGLTGVVIGLGVLWERRTALPSLFTAASVALAAAGASGILASGYASDNQQPTFVQSPANHADMASPAGSVCDDSKAIVVCVHPAYERMLSGVAEDVNTYLAPIAGLNGVVDEVYISSGNGQSGGWDQEEGLAFTSIDLAFGNDVDAIIAREFWPMAFFMGQTDGGNGTDTVQYVVMTALVREIGVDDWPDHFHRVPATADNPDVRAAIDRFAVLSPDEQRAWLEANWSDLSHGRLTLENLP